MVGRTHLDIALYVRCPSYFIVHYVDVTEIYNAPVIYMHKIFLKISVIFLPWFSEGNSVQSHLSSSSSRQNFG
jgi:hypothetical protein